MQQLSLKQHIDKLGIEYKTNMEIFKNREFAETFIDLCRYFKITDEVREANDSDTPVTPLFEAFFSIGFYKGIEYALNHNYDTEVSDTDLLLKHQDLLYDEYDGMIDDEKM